MGRKTRILQKISIVLFLTLIFATLLSYFVLPMIKDRQMRDALGDPNAIVTDTARTPWIYVNEDGCATVYPEKCVGMTEFIIPDAVNGIVVTSFDMHHIKGPKYAKKIVLPPTLERLGEVPFHGFESLETIVISEGLKDTSVCFVHATSSLKTIYLPKSLENVGYGFLYIGKNRDITVYYAGTEEEWLTLGYGAVRTAERFHMVYETPVPAR